MQVIDGSFVYAASDLNNYLECEHLIELSRDVALQRRRKPEASDNTALIARKGDEHERRYYDEQRTRYGGEIVAFQGRADNSRAGLVAAETSTVDAMASGARLIYQATFFDGRFLGRTDFLRRIEVPSGRWAWSYEVIDTKLALSVKPYFLIQLCNYSEHISRIQERAPEYAYIVSGNGVERRFRVEDYGAYYRHLKAAFLAGAGTAQETYPNECAHCDVCAWAAECAQRRDRDDHLSIVAGIRRDQIAKLTGAGIATLAKLASARENERPRGMSDTTFENLRAQAAQQHKQRSAFASAIPGPRFFYDFRQTGPDSALANLPKPAAGDIFFDMEGDPLYRPDRGLEYLFGAYLPDSNEYRAFWAQDSAAERAAFEGFVDFVSARLVEYPDLHVYHYAPYETTALKRLMGRFASRENEIDGFLRGGVFVDLYPIVRQSLWISQPSYSIKKLEAFYGMERVTKLQRGDDSILMFENWLASGDGSILEDIRAYNEDDCRSTHSLREWLLRLRMELEATRGEPLGWLATPELREPPDTTIRTALEARLLDGLPEPDSAADFRAAGESVRARWLLGNLLQYYRREQKPEWWQFFDRCKNPNDLEEHDRDAIGGLRLRADIAPYKLGARDRNLVYTYEFPEQDNNLRGDVFSPYTGKKAGTIVALDDATCTLQMKLSGSCDPASLGALIPGVADLKKNKQIAMENVATSYLDGSIETCFRATAGILLARPPRFNDRPAGALVQPHPVTKEAVADTIRALDESHLFVQGPPGSGKSTTGAWAIVDLLAAGKRVGIVSQGHKAVHSLLRKVEATAHARRVRFHGVHKASAQTEGSAYESFPDHAMVETVFASVDLTADCQLVSGTTFCWADENLVGAFDYLFVDEAGQIPLADALVASRAARNVILLGDPLQLPHVSKGSHPLATGNSVLEHLLGDDVTVPEDRGIFLETSYRLEPATGRFISKAIYEGRLLTDPATACNRVDSDGLRGSGLRYLPVEHRANGRSSLEEARRIVHEVEMLLGGTVTVKDDPQHRIGEHDILIVTPYNLQRKRIGELLTAAGHRHVRVGTVDKFQGQEAPVVFFSMATSSDEDLPRDMAFLFDRNRFNVAVSRAQCMTVLVCSPALLETRCRTPEQMALVNLLCAFAEQAGC